jgi:hypothetical protein
MHGCRLWFFACVPYIFTLFPLRRQKEQLEIVGGDGSREFLYFCKHELQVSTRVHANNHKNIHKITFTDYEKITIPGISHHHIVIDCQCTRREVP